jgi:diadenosine tetraphosphatase ApaH/serine/threonine PP2A family protein phosphatase
MAAMVIEWTRRQLREEDVEWLQGLPYERKVSRIALVHGTLDMPDQWGYVFDILEAEASMILQDTAVCFHGHTHVPLRFELRLGDVMRLPPEDFRLVFGTRYFVNVGSVGQPRDGVPFGSYAIYDVKARQIRFRRVPYDIETAMEKNRRAGLPERLAERLAVGR